MSQETKNPIDSAVVQAISYTRIKSGLKKANGILWELLKLQILLILVLVLAWATSGAIMGSIDNALGFI